MKIKCLHGALRVAAATALAAVTTACSHTDAAMGWSDAKTPPPGMVFSNGMAPSSEGPPPSWYAQRFNRPRGLGEAIKQDRRALWDRDPSTFALNVGGLFFAQYQPWEHYLEIRSDKKDAVNVSCHWDPNGSLTILTADGNPAPAADTTETCNQLLDELEQYVAPGGILAHKGH